MADPVSDARRPAAQWWVPLGVAAVVLLVVVGSWSVLRAGSGSSPGSSGGPPLLHLAEWAPAGTGSPDPRYRLADGAHLPGAADQATVQRLLPPSDAARRDLVTTLGFAGPGTLTDTGWTWSRGTGGPHLSIQKDGQWSFEAGAPSPPPRPAPVPADKAIAMVSGLLRALDLTDAQAAPPAASTVLLANPKVDGRPTAGLVTVLSVGLAGMEHGAGWLIRSESGPAYPVVSARTAWDQLVRTPRPMPMVACPEPGTPGSDPVTCGGPITVTGARLGLALERTPEGQELVPAWLFTVDGTQQPLVEVAVEPRLVASASAGTGTGGGSGSSTGSGGVPVTVVTATPGPPVPPPSGTVPSDPQSRFTSVRAAGPALDVRFWGGVASCFGYDVRVRETPSVVQLRLVEHRVDGAQVCPDLAMEHQLRVTLGGPLGRRTVLDADSGAVLLHP